MKFECVKCGLCCRKAQKEILEMMSLPVHPRGEGCAHLTQDNQCGIYETRPDICRVNRVYELSFQGEMTWEEFAKINEEACGALQRDNDWVLKEKEST